LHTFMFLMSSKTSSSQRNLGLPIGLLDMGFYVLIFFTLLSSVMRSTWPNQFNLCFLINPIIFCPFSVSLYLYIHHQLNDQFYSYQISNNSLYQTHCWTLLGNAITLLNIEAKAVIIATVFHLPA
jgi:hypothetical protein